MVRQLFLSRLPPQAQAMLSFCRSLPITQLAEMAEKRYETVSELSEINGIGEARKKKYGEKLIKKIQEA